MEGSVGQSIFYPGQLTYVAAGDETTSKGGTCDDLDAEFPRGLQEPDGIILDVQGEGRVLDLDSGDGVDGVCPAKSWSRDLVESNVFDLPGSGEGECLDFRNSDETSSTHLTSSAIAATV